MDSLFLELFALFCVSFLAAITPGPDILFVLRNTLIFGIKEGFLSLLGIFCGWLVFLSLIYFGFSHLLYGSLIQGILNCIGGFYLLYIAYLLARKPKNAINLNAQNPSDKTHLYRLIFKGFFLNLSNPKAILFFAIIIAPFMSHNLELSLAVLLSTLCLAFIVVIICGAFFRSFISNAFFDKIDRACSVIFAVFAFLLFSASYHSFLSA